MAIDSMLLHKLARDKSEGGRKKFAESISDIFAQHYPTLSARERELIFDILARLVHDMEMALRRVVSEHLAALPDVPRNLAKVLAYDAIEVASWPTTPSRWPSRSCPRPPCSWTRT
jgi:uncharacterized protein (DUF2336 family)